jgi:hypothetical protein
MRAWWPHSDEPLAPPMNAIPETYFSRGEGNDASTTKALEDATRLHPRQAGTQEVPSTERWEESPMLTGEITAEIGSS